LTTKEMSLMLSLFVVEKKKQDHLSQWICTSQQKNNFSKEKAKRKKKEMFFFFIFLTY